MTSVVVDASVVVKWCLPVANEALVSEAQQMLDAHSRGELHFLVPDLFWAELGNVLWKAVGVGRTSRAASRVLTGQVARLNLLRVDSLPLARSLDDGGVAIERQIGKTLDGTARLWPFDLQPIDLCESSNPQHHAWIVGR